MSDPTPTAGAPPLRGAVRAPGPVALLFLCALAAYTALAVATGSYLYTADSDSRFWNATYSVQDPGFIVDTWNKPVLTGLAAGVIALGGGVVAVKLLQGLLAAAALAITADAARRAGARTGDAVAAAALAGLSPFWVRLVFSVLTELSCALFLAGALWLWSRRRFALAALVVSFSFLARFEAVFFAAALLPFLVRERSWTGIALLLAGPVAWNLAGWWFTGQPLFLLTSGPHDPASGELRWATFWLMLVMLPVCAGALLVPASARVSRVRGPALAIAAATLAGHTLAWTFDLMDSGGRPRYLVTIVPALAFAAAFGIQRFGRRGRAVLFAVAASLALVVAAYRPNSWKGSVVLAREPVAFTSSPTVRRLTGARGIAEWRDARPGEVVAWESGWAPGGAFDQIPPGRLALESELAVPAAWPWESDWAGRIYRFK